MVTLILGFWIILVIIKFSIILTVFVVIIELLLLLSMLNERDLVTLDYLFRRFGSRNVSVGIFNHHFCVRVFDGSKFRYYRYFIDLFNFVRFIRIK